VTTSSDVRYEWIGGSPTMLYLGDGRELKEKGLLCNSWADLQLKGWMKEGPLFNVN